MVQKSAAYMYTCFNASSCYRAHTGTPIHRHTKSHVTSAQSARTELGSAGIRITPARHSCHLISELHKNNPLCELKG